MRDMRWILFWVMLTQTVAALLTSAFFSFWEVGAHVYLQTLLIEFLAYPIPILLYAKTGWRESQETARTEFRMCRFPAYLIPIIILMAAGGQFLQILLNLPLTYVMGSSAEILPASLPELLAGILIVGAIPAAFEEFLMRGIVYGVMARYSTLAAAVFTTVMFALLHANPGALLGYLFLGMVLVFVLQRTGSVYATMLFHFVNNLTALLIGYFAEALAYMPYVTLGLYAAGAAAFVLSFVLLRAVTKKPVQTGRDRTRTILGQSFFCLPTLLCFAVVIAMLVMQFR